MSNKKPLLAERIFSMVEAMGFEPMTSWSRTKRATKLHHASIYARVFYHFT
jgi:hypothetical protein